MPCRGPDEAESHSDTKEKLDVATRLLCSILREHPDVISNSELANWWEDHKKLDDKRIREEEQIRVYRERVLAEKARQEHIKEEALKKLSAEEILALGLLIKR